MSMNSWWTCSFKAHILLYCNHLICYASTHTRGVILNSAGLTRPTSQCHIQHGTGTGCGATWGKGSQFPLPQRKLHWPKWEYVDGHYAIQDRVGIQPNCQILAPTSPPGPFCLPPMTPAFPLPSQPLCANRTSWSGAVQRPDSASMDWIPWIGQYSWLVLTSQHWSWHKCDLRHT